MNEHDPTQFYETDNEYDVQHMTDEFGVWNTLGTYTEYSEAIEHAQDYAKGNPEIEVRVVDVMAYNY